MGTDATAIIERFKDGYWEPIGILPLPRNYDFFTDIREGSCYGYPADRDELTKKVLETVEDWGECYMNYKDWLKLLKKYGYKHLNVVKKKYYDQCRVICRFDC